MITNLDQEIVYFQKQVKEGESVKIVNLKNYSAAGSINIWLLLLLLILVLFKRKYYAYYHRIRCIRNTY